MEVLSQAVQVVGAYIYQIGETTVVGISNAGATIGTGLVDVLKAIFTGTVGS